jgi:multicomponent Na+:H+ antiporter subunit A
VLIAVLAGFAGALVAAPLVRWLRSAAGFPLALLPAGLCAWFASHAPAVARGERFTSRVEWVPGLSVDLAFSLDGLSLIFALLITGIGAGVLLYAGSYLGGEPRLGRFYAVMLAFMASMLGVVLADELIALFVFWELTSLTSYLLIGYHHERAEARASALMALLVTGGGGLALLAGFVLLGAAGGTTSVSALLELGDVVRGHALYPAILALVLLGAFTKSAQVPFHFWLPRAMAAPTPVSTYLHSATMVKAGVYLLARLAPTLGETAAWHGWVGGAGALTMITGAVLAIPQRDLKLMLAYTTVSGLGTLTMLVGIGGPEAAIAAVVFLVVHALYKATLFLVVGALDHEAGSRELGQLGGLRRAMPITCVAAALAGLSMAGLPPFLGFVGKELIYTAQLGSDWVALFATVAVLGNALTLAAAALAVLRPFWGSPRSPIPAHEGPAAMWLPPLILASLGLLLGAAPGLGSPLFAAAAAAVAGIPVAVELHLWHGLNLPLLLSGITIALGLLLYAGRERLVGGLAPAAALARIGPERGYVAVFQWTLDLARWQTRLLQSGRLRRYVLVILLSVVTLISFALYRSGVQVPALSFSLRPGEAVLAVVALVGTWSVVHSRLRLAAVAALGAVGYSVALLFLRFGGPDLAMTQFAIETLSVILFVFVLYRLPRFSSATDRFTRIRDGLVASAAGALVTGILWRVTAEPHPSPLTDYYAASSVTLAKGRNVVNVILVDFRALDTLGEITVLAAASLGVAALVYLGRDTEH